MTIRAERRERGPRRLLVHSRRMIGAMLCWSMLQAAASQIANTRAEAEPYSPGPASVGR